MAKKILIVEDEEYLADMYKIKFESEGYAVIVAIDGETGIQLAQSVKPDLILLDLVLPRMDGFQVLKELRHDGRTKDIIIYILSNLGQDEEIKKGFADGANGYLIKANLTPAQLMDYVERIFAGEKVGIKVNEGESK